MNLSLVVPAFNEEKNIVSVVNQMLDFLDQNFKLYELIVVDDGSRDNTIDKLNSIGHPKLKVIALGQNIGKGKAIQEGMSLASGKYCFFTDADLPYRLESILESIKIFESKKASLVIGSRHMHTDDHDKPYPLHRKIMSKSFSFYIKCILNLGISDTQCGFKGFTNKSAKDIFPLITINGFGFDVEMLFIAQSQNCSIEQIAVNMNYTEDSKVNIVKDSLKMFADILTIKRNDYKGKYKQKKNYDLTKELS